jgi:uncharacterized protein YraI
MLKLARLFAAIAAVVGMMSAAAGAATARSCSTSRVQIRMSGSSTASELIFLTFSYRNVTSQTCTTSGFPGVTLYSDGRTIAVATRHNTRPYSVLSVGPGRSVYGVVEWVHFPSPGHEHCPAVTGLGIYAPKSTQLTRVPLHGVGTYCSAATVYPLGRTAHWWSQ